MHTSTAVRIAFDDVGDGEPALVFLPGWCANRTAFRGLLEPAGRHRRALALDWRGHGGSERLASDYTTGDLVDDAIAVIEASGTETVVPVGLSHGGWVAVELRRRLGAARRPRDDLPGLDVPRTAREIGARFAAEGSPAAALERLDPPCPTLHVYAQPRDAEVLAPQEAYARAHPWFRVHRLDATTHFPMFEIPEELTGIIEDFAGELAERRLRLTRRRAVDAEHSPRG